MAFATQILVSSKPLLFCYVFVIFRTLVVLVLLLFPQHLLAFVCTFLILSFFGVYCCILLAIFVTIAPPLVPPKGFKFYRFFSRVDPNIASTSQTPPSDVVVPSTNLEVSEELTTPNVD